MAASRSCAMSMRCCRAHPSSCGTASEESEPPDADLSKLKRKISRNPCRGLALPNQSRRLCRRPELRKHRQESIMTRTWLAGCAAASFALALAVPASAADYKSLDTNADNSISQEEWN